MRVLERVQKTSTAIETNNHDHLRLSDKKCSILKQTDRYVNESDEIYIIIVCSESLIKYKTTIGRKREKIRIFFLTANPQ